MTARGPMTDEEYMALAVQAAAAARHRSSPNPWVGAVVVDRDGNVATGATHPPGGPHAEVVALGASADARGATLYTTLEPCIHHGRTGPCTESVIDAGVARVVVGVEDPDPAVAGRGVERLRAAGVDVTLGVGAAEVAHQLRPYLHHRRSGRPWVVLKLAASLDGRTAAPDGSSRWITGATARRDVHRLRAESDAVVVGSATVRVDDPELTVRDWPGPAPDVDATEVRDPRRVVLGTAATGAKVHPCLEWHHGLDALLDTLGSEGVVQVLVEGGASVAHSFHAAGLVDQYTIYLAPALFGGDDGAPLFRGSGAVTMGDVWRGDVEEATWLDGDLRVDLVPADSFGAGPVRR